MPATAKMLGVTNPLDPAQSAMGGAKYMKDLLAHYNGNVNQALPVTQYGPTAYDRATARGQALPSETQAYQQRVQAIMGASSMGGAGFDVRRRSATVHCALARRRRQHR